MDYVLLAATAMGAVALFLMLPRERAPMARLGGLLGVMAIATLFLFLIRAAAQSGLATKITSAGGPPPYFYFFAFIMIASAVMVITQPRPVYAALYFVLVTLAGAGMFVLLLAEFMAIVLIIIYAGAILVTYVFVIMLASQGSTNAAGTSTVAPAYDRTSTTPLVSVAVAFILIGAVLQVLLPSDQRVIATSQEKSRPDLLMAANLEIPISGPAPSPSTVTTRSVPTRLAASRPATANTVTPATPSSPPASPSPPSNVQVLGANLYSQYAFSLELAGILLTIALVGAVVIARKNTEHQPLGTGKLPSE